MDGSQIPPTNILSPSPVSPTSSFSGKGLTNAPKRPKTPSFPLNDEALESLFQVECLVEDLSIPELREVQRQVRLNHRLTSRREPMSPASKFMIHLLDVCINERGRRNSKRQKRLERRLKRQTTMS
jgi:hypothetical protein